MGNQDKVRLSLYFRSDFTFDFTFRDEKYTVDGETPFLGLAAF